MKWLATVFKLSPGTDSSYSCQVLCVWFFIVLVFIFILLSDYLIRSSMSCGLASPFVHPFVCLSFLCWLLTLKQQSMALV